VLADRYPALRAAVEKAGYGGGWKTTTVLARCLGFVLGLIACGMFAGVLTPFGSPWLVGGLLVMVAAEWLVAQRRVFRSGIEEALYLCGSMAVAGQILAWVDGSDAFSVGLLATAALLVGWRLLNPLFTTLAAAGFSLSIGLIGAHLFGSRQNTLAAAGFCVALAIAALLAGWRQWRRPSHDHMLDGLVILMPWCAHGWLLSWDGYRSTVITWVAVALASGFFIAHLAVGAGRRVRAPFIAALGNLACAASGLFMLLHWPRHWELIIAGGLLLVAAVLLERNLRAAREGITSRALDEATGLDLAQLAGVAHITPAPEAAPITMQGQGGGFGGGGASGQF
jgi:hypothetical protein